MPLFRLDKGGKATQVTVTPPPKEKLGVQTICERNLEELFKIRLVASEYVTSKKEGRIDTLGLDENNAPVIVEYKRTQNQNIVTQGFFYLDWLTDHKGDFAMAAQKSLDKTVKIDWSGPRLILVAESFSKYDTHAVAKMGQNVELKTYRFYGSDIFYVEDVFAPSATGENTPEKDKVASKQPYFLSGHLEGRPEEVQKLFGQLRDSIFALDAEGKIRENITKSYVAYQTSRNFCELNIQKQGLKVYLDMESTKIKDPKGIVKDCSKVGRWATGETVFGLQAGGDIDYALSLVKQAYELTL